MKKFISIFSLVCAIFTGCKGYDESAQHYTNKVFISANGNYAQEIRVTEEDHTITRTFSIAMAKPEGKTVSVTLSASPEKVDWFCQAYYEPDAVMLPEKHYDLGNGQMMIASGKVASDPLDLDFTDLNELDMDKVYVLPLTISTSDIEVLNGGQTLFYVFKEASLINVAGEIVGDSQRLWPGSGNWKDGASTWADASVVRDMEEFTLEAMIYINEFSNREIATVMGIEDVFMIRLGDAGMVKNQLHISYGMDVEGSVNRESLVDPLFQLKNQRWYHIAATFDHGEIKFYLDGRKSSIEKNSATNPNILRTMVDFSVQHQQLNFGDDGLTPNYDEPEKWGEPRFFWIGYAYAKGRQLNGRMAEARIWNKALTAEEINSTNHFYKVDPASDGLVCYWKFDDGAGNVVTDYSGNGNHLQSYQDLSWVTVALPAKE